MIFHISCRLTMLLSVCAIVSICCGTSAAGGDRTRPETPSAESTTIGPWIDTFKIYEKRADGFYRRSRRHGGAITISRKNEHFAMKAGDGREIHGGRSEILLRKVSDRRLEPVDGSRFPLLWVDLKDEDHPVLVGQFGFVTLYLVAGEPPKNWKLANADIRSPYEIVPLQPLLVDRRITRPTSDKLLVGLILSEKSAGQFRMKYGVAFKTDNIDFDKQMLVFGITDSYFTRAFQLLLNRRTNAYVLDYYGTGAQRRLPPTEKGKKYSVVDVFVTGRKVSNERGVIGIGVKNVIYGQHKVFADSSPPVSAPAIAKHAKWDLVRYSRTGIVENVQNTELQLTTDGNKLSGDFFNKRAFGKINESIFSGEVVRRGGVLLTLRQSDDGKRSYAAVYSGHAVGSNHYRGTWYDNALGSGEFSLKMSKLQAEKTPPEPKLRATIFDTPAAGIFDMAVSPDGKTVATTSRVDKFVQLWDVNAKKRIGSLKGDGDAIFCVAFSPDGQTLATGSGGGTIRLWDARNQRVMATIRGHSSMVAALAFSPDGTLLASVSADSKNVTLWDVATGKTTAVLAGHKKSVLAIAFAPDGRTLATGGGDGVIKTWDLATAKETASFQAHRDSVFSLAFSPDGSKLASGASGPPDDNLKMWDTATKKAICTIKAHAGSFGVASVLNIAFSPDGKTLASAGTPEDSVVLWDTAEQKGIAALTGHKMDSVTCLGFTRDGKTLVSAGSDKDGGSNKGVIKLWDVSALQDAKAMNQNQRRRIDRHRPDEVSTQSPYEVIPLKPLLEKRIVHPASNNELAGVILSEEQANQFRATYNVAFESDNLDFGKQMFVYAITDIIYTRAFQLLRNRHSGNYVLDYYDIGLRKDLPDPGRGKKYSIVQVFVTRRNETIGRIRVKNIVFREEKPIAKSAAHEELKD